MLPARARKGVQYRALALCPHDVSFIWELPNTLPMPTTLVGPPQRVLLVSAQNENQCTVGEIEEGATLIGFPGDDVCVAAT